MTDKKNSNNKNNEKNLEYSIMGDAFIGSISSELDNSSQNFIISMERDKILKGIKNKNNK